MTLLRIFCILIPKGNPVIFSDDDSARWWQLIYFVFFHPEPTWGFMIPNLTGKHIFSTWVGGSTHPTRSKVSPFPLKGEVNPLVHPPPLPPQKSYTRLSILEVQGLRPFKADSRGTPRSLLGETTNFSPGICTKSLNRRLGWGAGSSGISSSWSHQQGVRFFGRKVGPKKPVINGVTWGPCKWPSNKWVSLRWNLTLLLTGRGSPTLVRHHHVVNSG